MKPTMLVRTAMYCLCVAILSACANAGIGISIPIGPFGSIGFGVNAAGQVTGNLGVGTSVGGVGVGCGTSFPLGTTQNTMPAPQ
jgi:hypothetical protein